MSNDDLSVEDSLPNLPENTLEPLSPLDPAASSAALPNRSVSLTPGGTPSIHRHDPLHNTRASPYPIANSLSANPSQSPAASATTPRLSKKQQQALRLRLKTDRVRDHLLRCRRLIADWINVTLLGAEIGVNDVTPTGLRAKGIVLKGKSDRARVLEGNGKRWRYGLEAEIGKMLEGGEVEVRWLREEEMGKTMKRESPWATLSRAASETSRKGEHHAGEGQEVGGEYEEEDGASESDVVDNPGDDEGESEKRTWSHNGLDKKKQWVYETRTLMANHIMHALPGAKVGPDDVTTRGLRALGIAITATTERAKILLGQQNYWRMNMPIKEILKKNEYQPNWIEVHGPEFDDGQDVNPGGEMVFDSEDDYNKHDDGNSSGELSEIQSDGGQPEEAAGLSKDQVEYRRRRARGDEIRKMVANYINSSLPGANVTWEDILPATLKARGIELTATTKRAAILIEYWKKWKKDTPAAKMLAKKEIVVRWASGFPPEGGDVEVGVESDSGMDSDKQGAEEIPSDNDGYEEVVYTVKELQTDIKEGKRVIGALEEKLKRLERAVKRMRR